MGNNAVVGQPGCAPCSILFCFIYSKKQNNLQHNTTYSLNKI